MKAPLDELNLQYRQQLSDESDETIDYEQHKSDKSESLKTKSLKTKSDKISPGSRSTTKTPEFVENSEEEATILMPTEIRRHEIGHKEYNETNKDSIRDTAQLRHAIIVPDASDEEVGKAPSREMAFNDIHSGTDLDSDSEEDTVTPPTSVISQTPISQPLICQSDTSHTKPVSNVPKYRVNKNGNLSEILDKLHTRKPYRIGLNKTRKIESLHRISK